jgi:hypothetical protein
MFLSIIKSGKKADVIEQIQAETTTTPLKPGETAIRRAIAQHLQEFATADVPVSVSVQVNLSYSARLDTDGKEIPVTETGDVTRRGQKVDAETKTNLEFDPTAPHAPARERPSPAGAEIAQGETSEPAKT